MVSRCGKLRPPIFGEEIMAGLSTVSCRCLMKPPKQAQSVYRNCLLRPLRGHFRIRQVWFHAIWTGKPAKTGRRVSDQSMWSPPHGMPDLCPPPRRPSSPDIAATHKGGSDHHTGGKASRRSRSIIVLMSSSGVTAAYGGLSGAESETTYPSCTRRTYDSVPSARRAASAAVSVVLPPRLRPRSTSLPCRSTDTRHKNMSCSGRRMDR